MFGKFRFHVTNFRAHFFFRCVSLFKLFFSALAELVLKQKKKLSSQPTNHTIKRFAELIARFSGVSAFDYFDANVNDEKVLQFIN